MLNQQDEINGWQDDERDWHHMCDNYAELVVPSEEEMTKMALKQSQWYRTDGGVAYCKTTNIFFWRGNYYRVTPESIKKKKRLLLQQQRQRLSDKLAENLQFQQRIEEKLKAIDAELELYKDKYI